MSLSRQYARTLRKHLRCHAVWPPATAVAPGDYGVFVRGLWTRVGNVTIDFGVPISVEPGGNRLERFVYQSDSNLGGGGQVAGAIGSVDAELAISLAERSSFYVSVADFDVDRLTSIRKVALALRDRPSWAHLRTYVVWETLHGRDLVFYGSDAGEAGVKVRGEAASVKQFRDAGKLSADLSFTMSGEVGVQFRTPPGGLADIGVNLFRVRSVGATPESLSFGGDGEDDPVDYLEPDDVPDDDDDAAA